MKDFYVFDNSTKEIVRSGSCQDHHLNDHNLPGCTLVEGSIGPENKVVDGVPVYIPPPPPTQEEVARIDEFMSKELLASLLPIILLEYENRLRDLEKKPQLTKEEFKDAIRGMI